MSYDLTLVQAIERQRDWSRSVFGPGTRTKGLIEHIRKELVEVEESDGSLEEWIDVLILTLDALWRTGTEPVHIEEYLTAKFEANTKRKWPDYRQFSENEPIEHVRYGGDS